MSLFGSLIGWDQQKEAHNAVLANHLAQTADAEQKQEIAQALTRIQRNFGSARGSDEKILADMNALARIVQMNFIAIACDNLGCGSNLPGIQFAVIRNPYGSNNKSSLDRIGVALQDLSRRSGVRLTWPGNEVREDFLAWAGLSSARDQSGVASPWGKQIDTSLTADLAYNALLLQSIDRRHVEQIAREFGGIGHRNSHHELAIDVSMFFFEKPEIAKHLFSVQLMARMNAADWFREGMISARCARDFEDRLYEIFKP